MSKVDQVNHTIVIALAGWVFVGKKKATTDGVTLTDASVVRVWGTTKGIGEIALSGPLGGTLLDPCGEVSLPTASVVAQLKCNW